MINIVRICTFTIFRLLYLNAKANVLKKYSLTVLVRHGHKELCRLKSFRCKTTACMTRKNPNAFFSGNNKYRASMPCKG
jgi:hypothetical protein